MIRLTEAQQQERTGDTAMMAFDAMASLSFAALCDVIQAHIEGRPDVDVDRLQALGNAMCRYSDKVDLENRRGTSNDL